MSPRFTLNKDDLKKWAKNALIFLAPALLVLLASVSASLPKDVQWGVVALYVVNILTDLLRKFIDGQPKQ